MSDFKEFQGKNLDAAIAEACAYYDAPREKLEIDILEDSKTGIFGLVGARKARIRARRAQLPGTAAQAKPPRPVAPPIAPSDEESGTGAAAPKARSGRSAKAEKPAKGRKPEAETDVAAVRPLSPVAFLDDDDDSDEVNGNVITPANAPKPTVPAGRGRAPKGAAACPSPQTSAGAFGNDGSRSRDGRRTPRPAAGEASRESRPAQPPSRQGRPPAMRNGDAGHDGDSHEMALPRLPLAELDQEKLRRISESMVLGLIRPVVGEAPLEIRIADDRVQVQINCEDSGLLIGREGQNLAAVQYLAARMITRAMGAQVRIQVDAGEYHSRQDLRLQELALNLAEKVRATGKSQSTKPLSAYQRRVIHLALQDDFEVQTRSSGEGPLKRVVIQRRRDGGQG